MHSNILRSVLISFLRTLLLFLVVMIGVLAVSNIVGSPVCDLEGPMRDYCSVFTQIGIIGLLGILSVVFSFGATLFVPWLVLFTLHYTNRDWRWYVGIIVAILLSALMWRFM